MPSCLRSHRHASPTPANTPRASSRLLGCPPNWGIFIPRCTSRRRSSSEAVALLQELALHLEALHAHAKLLRFVALGRREPQRGLVQVQVGRHLPDRPTLHSLTASASSVHESGPSSLWLAYRVSGGQRSQARAERRAEIRDHDPSLEGDRAPFSPHRGPTVGAVAAPTRGSLFGMARVGTSAGRRSGRVPDRARASSPRADELAAREWANARRQKAARLGTPGYRVCAAARSEQASRRLLFGIEALEAVA